ncbi:MAG: PEP-CTERM sorting domain-containing protein [Roseiarcus sp.]
MPVIASTTQPLATLPLPTQPLVTTTPPPFVQNVLVTPNGTTPTLQWTVPNGYTPDAQSIYIYDKSLQTPNHLAPLVYLNNNIGLATTWTVPNGVFGGPNLPTTDNYIISIQLDQTNPSLPSPENIEGRSRTYVNFNIGSLTSPVYVPTITANGAYQFDISVTTGQTYPIDPIIATGFEYAIGAGNPNFATVLLPDLQGTDPYTITWDNGKDTEKVVGGDLFSFLPSDPLGVSAFTVTGIDPADGVDPSSGTDFVTNLTFVGNGSFTGTMTPITASIPEPSTWCLMLLGFAGLGFAGYRKVKTWKTAFSAAGLTTFRL